MGIYIALALVVAAILGVVGYYVARFLKGKLTISLPKMQFRSKEVVGGDVTLEAKRPADGFLQVSLVGRYRERSRRSDGRTRTRWVELYRDSHVVEETRHFRAGFREAYRFELLAPTDAEVNRDAQAIERLVDSTDGLLGKVLRFAARGTRRHIHWHVEARLDAEGVDLYAKRKLEIDLFDEQYNH